MQQSSNPSPEAPLIRVWPAHRPVDLAATLGPLRRGGGDPTYRSLPGAVWRTARTPQGPATQRISVRPGEGGSEVEALAWGPGAAWLLEALPGRPISGERLVKPDGKISLGFFLTAAAFCVSAWIETRISAGETPHIIWQIVAYMILTAAEVMVDGGG